VIFFLPTTSTTVGATMSDVLSLLALIHRCRSRAA
jgi:hypothetical protein